MPFPPLLRSRASRALCGFTIIEIAVILVIIALMLAIIVPHFFSLRAQAKANRVKADLETLNSAIEHYALDNGKTSGVAPTFADLKKYLSPRADVSQHQGKDIFGDSYGPLMVGSRPRVPARAAEKLSSVAGPDFWSPYQ